MRTLLFAFFISLFTARAGSVISMVEPNNPHAAGFAFDIKAKTLSGRIMRFSVKIAEDRGKFSSKPSASLSIVKISKSSKSIEQSITPVQELELASAADRHSMTAVISIAEKSLADPDLYFVFMNQAESLVNGTLVAMPGADFLCVRLQDFAPNVVSYTNPKYGLKFRLTPDWRGYKVISKRWQGTTYSARTDQTKVVARGAWIILRHPLWSKSQPYQDIPIMVFTRKQWEDYHHGKFSGPYAGGVELEIGRNSKYVFAVSSRFNADDSVAGWKEVTELVTRFWEAVAAPRP
jgi:hypothetical protein